MNNKLTIQLKNLSPFINWALVKVVFTKKKSIYQSNNIARRSQATSHSTLDLPIMKTFADKQ